jgi:hypothetical protein
MYALEASPVFRPRLTAERAVGTIRGFDHLNRRIFMRGRLAAAAVLTLGCGAAVFAQAGSKAAIEKTLMANENKITDAVAKHDVKTFTDLVASDAVSADANGFMKVADFVKSMDQMKIASQHTMDMQVTWVDDKTAIVRYTWMGSGTYMGQAIPPATYASTVWSERNGKWVAVFHQETPMAPPPPPAKKK